LDIPCQSSRCGFESIPMVKPHAIKERHKNPRGAEDRLQGRVRHEVGHRGLAPIGLRRVWT